MKRSGTDAEKRYASRIIPVIANEHFLLVTLLLCNAAATEASGGLGRGGLGAARWGACAIVREHRAVALVLYSVAHAPGPTTPALT